MHVPELLVPLLKTRWGSVLLLLLLTITINSWMYMVASLINPYTSPQLGTSYSTLVNALRASPFEGRNTSIETDQIPQIDFVYTWVNGSDPKQLESTYRVNNMVKFAFV
jgi:hypothetical protein